MLTMHFNPKSLLYNLLLPVLVQQVAGNVFEQLHQLPQSWTFERDASLTEPINLRISLQHQNVDSFYQKFMAISTPSHIDYGKHMDNHEIRNLLKPKDESLDAILDWLEGYNITDFTHNGDWVTLQTKVENANRLLNTNFSWYRSDDGEEILRTMQYSLPWFVSTHINFIQPTTRFGNLKQMRSSIKTSENIFEGAYSRKADLEAKISWRDGETKLNATVCNGLITPQCLFELYNIHYSATNVSKNKIAYASFLEEYAQNSDLDIFTAAAAPYAAGQNFSVVEYNGGLSVQDSDTDSQEANLDNQYIISMGYPIPVTEISTGGRGLRIPDGDSPNKTENSNEPYLDFLLGLMDMPNEELPQTISISYGENEQEIPSFYAQQVCFLFAQLGARGVSVLFASGDYGAGGYCEANDGTSALKLQPSFPASCPYVTSVGGTMSIPETASYFSGGGFSNYFPRPVYQDAAVADYLGQVGDANQGYYNINGRGYPDVSAQSFKFVVYDRANLQFAQGTSCAAPVFASVIALLNNALLRAALPPMGFLNPWLYSIGKDGLNDITTGGNTGCDGHRNFHGSPNGSPVIPNAGWNATQGWDPVSGLGTPDFGKLLKIVAPWAKNEGGVLGGCGET